MISTLYNTRTPGVSERIAFHLIEGSRSHEAIEPLLRAARERLATSEFAATLRLLDTLEHILAQNQVEASDPRHGQAQIIRARVFRLQWKFDDAAAWAEKSIQAAVQHGWVAVQAEALLDLAHIARQRGQKDRAPELAHEALALFSKLQDESGIANSQIAIAASFRIRGELDASLKHYQSAQHRFEILNDDERIAACLLGQGHVCRQRQRYQEAMDLYARARAIYTRLGNQNELANCTNGLAEAERFQGLLDVAEKHYREAIRLFTAIGSKEVIIPRLNLGLVLIKRERWSDARREFESGVHFLQRTGQRGFLAWASVCLLPCFVATEDLATFERSLPETQALLEETSLVDPDIAECAELAASMLVSRDRTGLAFATYRIALLQWRALENTRKELDVFRKLEGIGALHLR